MPIPVKTLVARLTPLAREAIEQAASRALSRSHFEIEIEHVLLSLLDQHDNAACAALRALNAPLVSIEAELQNACDGFRAGNTRNPLLSAWLPKWLEQAWLYASAEQSESAISTLDLLLALRSDEGLSKALSNAVPSLYRFEVAELSRAYRALREQGGEAGDLPVSAALTEGGVAQGGQEAAPSPRARGTPGLDKYTIDLTAAARAGKIDPIIGRDAEIRQMIDILMRRRQNNPILTGEPGVGKTAVVEGLALKIASQQVPPPLMNVVLRTLDLGLLQAGASVKGEFENRLRQVMDEVKASSQPIILFIDEAHTMIGAGGAAGQNDAANLLKPALARGELRTIAATTWAEYKKYFEKDAALARRFQVIKVEEPAPEVAQHMLRALCAAMSAHHQVTILEEAVTAAVQLSSRYISGRQLPDKAISVLDTACARVALARSGRPAALEDLDVLLANLEREQQALSAEYGHEQRLDELAQQRQNLLASRATLEAAWLAQSSLTEEIDALKAQLAEAHDPQLAAALQQKRAALQQLHADLPLAYECVDENAIADVVSAWTGVPLGRMVSNELEQVRQLEQLLAGRVIGQPHALQAIAEKIRIAKANLDDPSKPKGVFMLVGPSGVGKTETALALAEALYGGERNLITINMSEYQEAHTVSSLKGSPPGYVGYGEGGVLTEAVRRRPYSVVLLDEVEKAHPDVMELFFQVFDKGVLEDGEGREIDFKNTVILLTSNSGSELVMRAVEQGIRVEDETRDPTGDDLVELLRPTLQHRFKPALLGRLAIIPYFPISDEVLRQIVALKLTRISQRIVANHGAELVFDAELVELLAQRCMDVESGARDADAIINRALLAPLSGEMLARMAQSQPVSRVHFLVGDDGQLQLSLS